MFCFSLWGCKEWSCWIASKLCHFLITLSATMASTWRRLVADGRSLGRQWLQGKLSEESATRLRQLVVESGAASSSRATKGESLAMLLEMFDRSSSVSRRLWCFSLFLFFLCFRFASSKIRVFQPCVSTLLQKQFHVASRFLNAYDTPFCVSPFVVYIFACVAVCDPGSSIGVADASCFCASTW